MEVDEREDDDFRVEVEVFVGVERGVDVDDFEVEDTEDEEIEVEETVLELLLLVTEDVDNTEELAVA